MFATWVVYQADNICFDAGDGLVSRLRQKVVRINTMAISHSHRDHVAGLFMFLNVRLHQEGAIEIAYPCESRFFRDLERYLPCFERQFSERVIMRPMMPGDTIPLAKKNLFMEAFATHHYRRHDTLVRSLGYHLVEKKRKVRGPLRHLSQQEIFSLIRKRGADEVLEDVRERYLTFSGDTAPLEPEVFAGTKLLIHECTFLEPAHAEAEGGEARYHRHSHLDAVMRNAVEGQVGGLGLYHLSSRYTTQEIIAAVQAALNRYNPSFPVSLALPGAFVDDLMRRNVNPTAEPTEPEEKPALSTLDDDQGPAEEPED